LGSEFGQGNEWNAGATLDWYVLQYPFHQGVQRLVADLNRLYRDTPALHQLEFEPRGFEWIDCHDAPQSTLSYLRCADDQIAVVALNFTPVPRHDYRLGVPRPGAYREAINSDSDFYAGSNLGNAGLVEAEAISWMGRPYSISITLPPLAGVVFLPA
jgi:1,4-alpha-glucan branching enzyme